MYRKQFLYAVLLQVYNIVILVSCLLYYHKLSSIAQNATNKNEAYSVVEAPKPKKKSEIEGLSQVTQNALLLTKKNTIIFYC